MGEEAQVTVRQAPATLQTSGTGLVEVAPDSVTVDIGVTSEGVSLEDVQREGAERMARVRQAITVAGVADRDLRTNRYNVSEQRDYQKNEHLGYQVSNGLTVTFGQIDQAGALLDAVTAAGANAIGALIPIVSERRQPEMRARELAIGEAMARAEVMVTAAGVQLGRIVSIVDGATPSPFQPVLRSMAFSDAAPKTTVEAGTEGIMATVEMVFEISP